MTLDILILGSTGFLGPHFIAAALARGHTVAAFTRDPSAVFPHGVQRIVGDRDTDLSGVERDWDAVLDLAAYGPRWVRRLGERLEGRVGRYLYISSIAAYSEIMSQPTIDETSALEEDLGDLDPFAVTTVDADTARYYGALKVACEREAEAWFPGRVIVLRPGYITGPGDPQGYLAYWPLRLAHGGDFLVPGGPDLAVQFIDVRDLAEWSIRLIEAGDRGTYTADAPVETTTLARFVEIARQTAGAAGSPVWVSPALLGGDRALWRRLLFWTDSVEWSGGFPTFFVNERAVAAGLTSRPIEQTIADTGASTDDLTAWPDLLAAERELITRHRASVVT